MSKQKQDVGKVHPHHNGWFFWDKNTDQETGPYRTQSGAEKARQEYIATNGLSFSQPDAMTDIAVQSVTDYPAELMSQFLDMLRAYGIEVVSGAFMKTAHDNSQELGISSMVIQVSKVEDDDDDDDGDDEENTSLPPDSPFRNMDDLLSKWMGGDNANPFQ